MHVWKEQHQGRSGAPARTPRPAPSRRPGAPGTAARPSAPGAVAALQRTAGNAAAVRALQRRQAPPRPQEQQEQVQPVGPSSVDKVLRSGGKPLERPVRAEMEARLGADFSDVRMHTGAAAQRSAAEMGARAYTTGSHVVIGQGGADRHTLAHELTHVIQQRQGPVSGTDNGSGLRVSDPSDRFEREAERTARTALSGPVPQREAGSAHEGHQHGAGGGGGTPHVQRYTVVEPGSEEYPVLGTLDAQGQRGAPAADFFPAQVQRPRTINDPTSTTGPRQGDSYVAADGTLNVEYKGTVPLRLAGNLDLAVEHVTGDRQAKTFFATQKRIDQANDRLKGKVRLDRGGNFMTLEKSGKYLKIISRQQELTLWQVEPVVTHVSKPEGHPDRVQRGLDVRLAQRCNEIATAVSAKESPQDTGEAKYFDILAEVLGKLGNGPSAAQLKQQLAAAKSAVSNDRSEANRTALGALMARMVQGVMALRNDPAQADALRQLYEKLQVNQYTPPAGIGDVFMIKALREDASSGSLDFHFGAVIAKSGPDHITMENFARHEETGTLSSKDPQWYFDMYGPHEDGQSFHQNWGWEERFAPGNEEGNEPRLVLTILLR